MPLRVKSLELQGYKTFAAKTNFIFASGITAIVGPNGSGKSNIADAIRWVLGEQSFSLLRAKKTDDMIFAGSEHRPRAGMAAATVVFDNSDSWLPVDFSEVALARRAYRDGRNEYLLNSQHVRLRDIYELLAQSGLSERTYTVLGQGLVDVSLALKADERRKLFEEAAGIGLYRSRREETLRRLDATQRNLDRVLDILAELEPRLKNLERQARRAQEYAQLQADLRVLLLDWYGYYWHHAQKELADVRAQSQEQETRFQKTREAFQTVRTDFKICRDRDHNLRAQLNSWHRQLAQLHESRESISRDLAVMDERRRALLDDQREIINEQSQSIEEQRITKEKLVEFESEINRVRIEYVEAETQVESARNNLEARLVEKTRIETDLQSERTKLDELNVQRAQWHARQDEITNRLHHQTQKIESIGQTLIISEKENSDIEKEYYRAQEAVKKAEAVVQKAEADAQLTKERMIKLEDQTQQNRKARAAEETELAKIKTQMDVIDQAEKSLSGYADGIKLLLDAARQSKLKGARGALSNYLQIPAELEIAIAATLGEYADAILLNSGSSTEKALSLLDTDVSGRASMLPLDWLKPLESIKASPDSDCLGVASKLIQFESEIRPVVELLLGQVLIVQNRAAARRILAGQPTNIRVVTLKGEVFHAEGPVHAGKPARAVVIGRPRQRRELHEYFAKIERRISSIDIKLEQIENDSNSIRDDSLSCEEALNQKRRELESAKTVEQKTQLQIETLRRQHEWQVEQKNELERETTQSKKDSEQISIVLTQSEIESEQVKEKIRTINHELASASVDESKEKVTYWGTRLAVTEHALSGHQTRQFERQQIIERQQKQQSLLELRLLHVVRSLEELEVEKQNQCQQENLINKQIEGIKNLIEPVEKELENAEAREAAWQKQEVESQQELTRIERQYHQIQIDLARKQENLDNLRHKIEDDFGLVAFEYASEIAGPVPLPFEGMVEQLPVLADLPQDLEENLTRQRALLRRMGPINHEAQKEYESMKQRFEFLNTQLDDLRKAEADLHRVIIELDEKTESQFSKTFAAVAEEFHAIFHRLFGGGTARLAMTDPDNITETGIDIEARLPGRREQGLALLSGGERSLTAIALIFALLKISPTPVCVLDEVDAMLDEANIARFRELLVELSKETQFIIITHNRNTVQVADVIYGVTMGRDSTSQVISLKLDEVSEEYLK